MRKRERESERVMRGGGGGENLALKPAERKKKQSARGGRGTEKSEEHGEKKV